MLPLAARVRHLQTGPCGPVLGDHAPPPRRRGPECGHPRPGCNLLPAGSLLASADPCHCPTSGTNHPAITAVFLRAAAARLVRNRQRYEFLRAPRLGSSRAVRSESSNGHTRSAKSSVPVGRRTRPDTERFRCVSRRHRERLEPLTEGVSESTDVCEY